MTLQDLQTKLETEISKIPGTVSLAVKFLTTSQTIQLNSQYQFWAASVIKIPIACEVYKQVNENKLKLETRYKISEENRVDGTGVIKLLDPADEFTLLDLVKLMLAVSDNSATNQIVDLIGWENVEKYMHNLNLSNTTYRHKLMITAGRGPNLTTAEDILKLLELLYTNKLVGAEEIIDILKQQQDRRRIPMLLPNEVPVAHKPGSLPEAMHDVGIIYSKNPFIFVFLSDDVKDKRLCNQVLSECARLCFEFSELL